MEYTIAPKVCPVCESERLGSIDRTQRYGCGYSVVLDRTYKWKEIAQCPKSTEIILKLKSNSS